jgi:uncharacterized DUF497 family protein
MNSIKFSWDERKNRTNQQNHGIFFEEAQTVFYDNMARLIDDPDHSLDEDRFILLGMSQNLRLIAVCHAYDEEEHLIRIISARKATKKEQQLYTSYF